MEATLDKKDKTLDLLNKKKKYDHWNDKLIQDYYLNYYQSLSAKELDEEFFKDLNAITKAINKIPDGEKERLIEILSKFIEFYLEKKIEKEIDQSLFKIIRI